MKKKLYDRTFDQQYLRFKRMEQADQIENIAHKIAGKGTRRAMEVSGSSGYYERLFLVNGWQRLSKHIHDEKYGKLSGNMSRSVQLSQYLNDKNGNKRRG